MMFVLELSDGRMYDLKYEPRYGQNLKLKTGGWTLTDVKTHGVNPVFYPLNSVSIGDTFVIIVPGMLGRPQKERPLKVAAIKAVFL